MIERHNFKFAIEMISNSEEAQELHEKIHDLIEKDKNVTMHFSSGIETGGKSLYDQLGESVSLHHLSIAS